MLTYSNKFTEIKTNKLNENEDYTRPNNLLVKNKKLIKIYEYETGDEAWLSLIDNNIYEYNLTYETFNVIILQELADTRLRPKINYTKWLELINNKKRKSCWD